MMRPPHASPTKELALHALFALVLLACLFPAVFLRGHVIAPAYQPLGDPPWSAYAAAYTSPHDRYQPSGEYLMQWVNWYSIAQKGWSAGEWPLWNPYQLTGVPLLANYQTAFFNPVRMPNAILDVGIAGTLSILIKLYLCGLTAYIYARGIRLGIGAAYVLSVAWMLSTLNVVWMYWCSSDVAIWLPIQLLGIDSLLEHRKRRGFLLIAMSGSLMLFAGHPETAFTMGLGGGLYFLLRLACAGGPMIGRFRLTGLALAAWLTALLVTSAQTLPFAEYLFNSATISQRASDGTDFAISPHALLAAWVPRYFGVTYTLQENFWKGDLINSNFTLVLYPGIAIWYGLVLLLSRSGRGGLHIQRLLCLLSVTILFLLIGINHPVSDGLGVLPFARTIWRFWFFPFSAFAVAVMAAIALDSWFASTPRPRQLVLPVLAACAVAVALWLYYALVERPGLAAMRPNPSAQIEHELWWALILGVIGLLIIALPVLRTSPRYSFPILVAFLVLDLLAVTRDMLPTCENSALHVDTRTTDLLRSRSDSGRVKSFTLRGDTIDGTVQVGQLPKYGIEELHGYDGLVPKRFGQFDVEWLFADRAARLLSVRFRIVPTGKLTDVPPDRAAQQNLISSDEGIDVYEDMAAFPRARLLSAASIAPNSQAAVATLLDPRFDPATTAILESPPLLPLPLQPNTTIGEARIASRTLNSVVVEANADVRSILVLSDQYFPGWKAYVDGVQSEVFPVYVLLRGVLLEPGRHTVIFAYEPASFRIGMWISTISLLAGCILTAGILRADRFHSSTPPTRTDFGEKQTLYGKLRRLSPTATHGKIALREHSAVIQHKGHP